MNGTRLNSPALGKPALLCPLLCLALCLPAMSRAQECIDYDDYPHIVGGISGFGLADDVAVVGDRAYVANHFLNVTKLHVIDIADPSAPVVAGEVTIPGSQAYRLAIAGTRAYVAVGSAGLNIVDISNPDSPVFMGRVDTPGTALDVAVNGTHAYIADGLFGLQVADISNPASPVLVGFAFTPGESRGVALQGGYAFIADDYAGAPFVSHLQVFDIATNATSPLLVGDLPLPPGQAHDVSVAGTHAYLACGSGGFDVVDISNPTSPQLKGGIETPGDVYSVTAASASLVFFGTSSLNIADVSNPNSPALVARVHVSQALGVALNGTHAFIAGSSAGVKVVDVSNPVAPPVVGQANRSGNVAVDGNYAYLSLGYLDLAVVDIADPAAPVVVTDIFNGDGGALDVAVGGNVTAGADYAFVIGGEALRVYNISDPTHPVLARSLALTGRHVTIADHYAYLAGFDGLRILDTSNPSFPIVASMLTIGEVRDVAVVGGYAYLLNNDGVAVVDVADPTSPALVGFVDIPPQGGDRGITAVDGYVYVANDSGLFVIDASDPTAPTVVGTALTTGTSHSAAIDRGIAYVADAVSLQVVDVSVPDAPQIIGTYGGRCTDVVVSGTLVFTADVSSTLTILPTQCATTAGVSVPPLAPGVASLETSFPNPFSGSTIIPYELPAPAQVSLRIYDIAGRLVRVLEENANRGVGRHSVAWNGRDARGHPLPAGVYLCRLDTNGRTETRRLTRLK
jgi:hypothetical protein